MFVVTKVSMTATHGVSVHFPCGLAGLPANAALLVHDEPVKLGPAAVGTTFTTIELGRTPVKVLLITS